MAFKDHKCKLTTFKKWEKELNCKLEYDVNSIDVVCLQCVVCKRWEKRIDKIKGFNTNWIRTGAMSIKKDGLKSHLHTNQHNEAKWLEKRSQMGAEVYSQVVIETSPIGCAIWKLQGKDKASLKVKFNITYYLAKRERQFTDYPHLITLEKKNHVKHMGNSYVTDRAVAVFIDYIGIVTK